MTHHQPPGNYPPPPPPPQAARGYPPAAAAGPAVPKGVYTPWGARALAGLIDFIPVAILQGIGWGLLLGTRETACVTDASDLNLGEFCATGASTLGQISIILTGLLGFAYWIWNLGFRRGTTGSSLGQSIMKFKLVNEKTGQPIGFGMSLVREILSGVAAGLCGVLWLVAVLFPLWDAKRQTLVDRMFAHIALPVQPQAH
jgi:uncharacterized RDD family membrane protein YckC